MRPTYRFLIYGLGLLLTACGSPKEDHSPPPLDKDMLLGKWEADDPEQLIQEFEFAADKSLHLKLRQVEETVPGTYEWSGNASLTLEYRPSDEAKKASAAVLAAVKQDLRDRAKKTPGPVGAGLQNAANNYPDELPAKETLRIGMSDRYGPVLVVTTEKGLNMRFKKPQ
jgi:uncharacterized protein (TIGR03066 family)